jgi:sugar lactone lactonase YvrE
VTTQTASATARPISTSRDRVGECPVWSVAEQALYWVDIEGRHIHRFDWANQTQQTWSTPERVGCIALTHNAGLISSATGVVAAMESGIFALTLLPAPQVQATCIAAIAHPQTNMRFNDGRCDRAGRFWVSTMCMDMSLAAQVGGIYCLDDNGLSTAKIQNLITPNGMAFSPDDRTMYLSDSHHTVQKIWAFDFDVATGQVSSGREFVDMTRLPGRPDGAAVDVNGNYWICANDAGQVHCFSPQGQLLSSVEVPVSKPSMCAFGGPDLDVLFIASIQPAAASGNDKALSGAVFALSVGVRGLPEPVFSCFPVLPSVVF